MEAGGRAGPQLHSAEPLGSSSPGGPGSAGAAAMVNLGFGATHPRSASCQTLESEATALISWRGISCFEAQRPGCQRFVNRQIRKLIAACALSPAQAGQCPVLFQF